MVQQAFDSDEAPKTKATPEDLVRCTKPITLATAKAVGAGNSLKQEDVIVAANMGRKAISDMLTTCKVIIFTFLLFLILRFVIYKVIIFLEKMLNSAKFLMISHFKRLLHGEQKLWNFARRC